MAPLHFLLVPLLLSLCQPAGNESPVRIAVSREPTGSYHFSVTNALACPVQISLDFTQLLSAAADEDLPIEAVIPPNTHDLRILILSPAGGTPVFRYTSRWWIGDPRTARHRDSHLYVFPFDRSVTSVVRQGYLGSFSHSHEYALDFDLTPGTLVCAARDGIVIGVRSDSDRGGPDPSYRSHANYVKIYHDDGTFADYVHLRYGGVLVAPGEEVRAGDVIGLSGNTGYSTQPHLHFAVHQPTLFGSKTVPTLFYGENGQAVRPVENGVYRSLRPAGSR